MAIQPALSTAWASSTPAIPSVPTAISAEDGIRDTCDRMAEAWCLGDAASMAAMLAPDCDHVTLTRVRQVKRGRGALVDSWRKAFARRGPGFSVRMTISTSQMRMLRDDLALIDGAFEYSEGIGADDMRQCRSSQAFSAIMVRYDLDWLVGALRVGPSTAAAKVVPCATDATA